MINFLLFSIEGKSEYQYYRYLQLCICTHCYIYIKDNFKLKLYYTSKGKQFSHSTILLPDLSFDLILNSIEIKPVIISGILLATPFF